MQSKLVPIGSSRGIRIPKMLIEKYHLQDGIDITEQKNGLLIQPKQALRSGWAEQFAALAKQETTSFEEWMSADNTFDEEGWEWK